MNTSKSSAKKTEPNRTAIPSAVVSVMEQLRQTVDHAGLPRAMRLKVAGAVRLAIVPRRKPGRKDQRLDKADADYRAGMRGLDLFRKHIPRHDKLSRWRRKAEQSKLLKTLQKRAERDRKRQTRPTIRGGELSARQSEPGNGHPDNSA